MRIGTSYKQHPGLADRWDAIVIGSGLGGLSAAARMSSTLMSLGSAAGDGSGAVAADSVLTSYGLVSSRPRPRHAARHGRLDARRRPALDAPHGAPGVRRLPLRRRRAG